MLGNFIAAVLNEEQLIGSLFGVLLQHQKANSSDGEEEQFEILIRNKQVFRLVQQQTKAFRFVP